MSKQAYDQKNTENYESNTETLVNALNEIEYNNELKATIAQLSKMTGIHRNTISNRGWPVQRLNEIKAAHKDKQKKLKEQRLSSATKTKALEQNLSQARNEIIHWFNEYQDMKLYFDHSNKKFQLMKESRDYYKQQYETERKSLLAAEQEIEHLKELVELNVVSSTKNKH